MNYHALQKIGMILLLNGSSDDAPMFFCGMHCRNIECIYIMGFHCNEFVHVQSIVICLLLNTNIENIYRVFLRYETTDDQPLVIYALRYRNIECIYMAFHRNEFADGRLSLIYMLH